MRKLFLLVVVLFTTALNAQDIVYLNNGNVIKGAVVQDGPTVVKIQLSNGSTVEYAKLEVRTIALATEKINKPKDPKRVSYTDYADSDKGWWCAVEVTSGGTLLLNKPNLGYLDLSVVNGYRFSEFIKIGIGVAPRIYLGVNNGQSIREEDNPWAWPIFLNLRGNFISQDDRMFSPYWSIDLGYCIRDNFFFAPTIGTRIGGKHYNFLVGLTYNGQMMSNNSYVSFLSGKIGYEF